MTVIGSRSRGIRQGVALAAVLVLIAALLAAIAPARAARAAATTGSGQLVPIASARIMDSRSGLGTTKALFASGTSRNLTVLGVGGVPSSGVSAVMLQVLSTDDTGAGYVQAWPAGSAAGTSSLLETATNTTVSNVTIVPVGTGGQVSLGASATMNLVVDVQGYVTNSSSSTTGSLFTAIPPNRIMDTRGSLGGHPGTLGAGQSLTLTVSGTGTTPNQIPTNATSVMVNITAVSPSAGSYLEAWPTGSTMPAAGTISITGGVSSSHGSIVALGTNGTISIYNAVGTTNLLVEIDGYFTSATSTAGSYYTPLPATRFVDTRSKLGGSGSLNTGTIDNFKATGFSGVPTAGVTAVAVDIVALNVTQNGYLQLYAQGSARPASVSTMLTNPGVNNTTFDIVQLSSSGQFSLYNSLGTADVLIDVLGYFESVAPPNPPVSVTVSPGPSDVQVSWQAPAVTNGYNVSSYTVTSTPDNQTCTTAALSCDVTGLYPGTTYTFAVTASTDAGTSPSATSPPATPTGVGLVPGAPTGVTVRTAQGAALVRWTAPRMIGTGITSYTVTPYLNGTAQTAISANPTLTSTIDTGLSTGGTYTFAVAANDTAGTGPSATTSSVTPTAVPAAPAGTAATQPYITLDSNWDTFWAPAPGAYHQGEFRLYDATVNYVPGETVCISVFDNGCGFPGSSSHRQVSVNGTVVTTLSSYSTCPHGSAVNTGNPDITPYLHPGLNDVQIASIGVCDISQLEAGPFDSQIYIYGASGQLNQAGGADELSPLRKNCPSGGDPVDCATGAFYHNATDFKYPGRGLSLNLSRTYNSLNAGNDSPFGYGWTSSYDQYLMTLDGGSTVALVQSTGNTTVFQAHTQYDSAGVGTVTYVPPAGEEATLIDNANGTWTLTVMGTKVLTFSRSGQLVSETDLNGQSATSPYATVLSYEASGRLSTVTDAAGRTLTFQYSDSTIHVTRIIDSTGLSVSYTYTGGNLTSVQDVNSGIATYSYSSGNLLHTLQSPAQHPNGSALTNLYNSSNQVLSQQSPTGGTTTYSYGTVNGNGTTTITDPDGSVTVDTYNSGCLIGQVRGSGTAYQASVSPTCDSLTGLPATAQDGAGHTTGYKYVTNPSTNGYGLVDTVTSPTGATTSYTYNALDEVTQVAATSPLGTSTTTNTYNAAGDLTSTSKSLFYTTGGTTTTPTVNYYYDDPVHPGDVTRVVDANGNTTTYQYDSLGDRVYQKDALGNITTWTFDGRGNALTKVSPKGNLAGAIAANFTTTYTYDSFGDVTSVKDADGNLTQYGYDGDRNLQAVTDARNNQTTNAYNAADQLVKTTQPDQTYVSYGYDPAGNRTSYEDGNRKITSYTYNPLNQLLTSTDPLLRMTSYTEDGAGDVLTVTAPSGAVTTKMYNSLDEVTGVTYSDGVTPSLTYTYYPSGELETSTVTNPVTKSAETSTTAYDSLDQVVSQTNGNGQTVSYGYDPVGNTASITYPDGHVLSRGFNADEQLSSVKDWNAATVMFGYDQDSNLKTVSYPSASTPAQGYVYDNADVLTSTTMGSTTTESYSRNPDQQIQSVSTTTPAQTTTYTPYTTPGLFTGVTNSDAYNAAGQPTTLAGVTQAFDAAGEITQAGTGATATTYVYNSNGDRTTATPPSPAPAVTYGYNQGDQLVSVAAGKSSTATYTYDANGLRATKTVGTAASQFAWDTVDGVPTLLTDGTADYIYGPRGQAIEQTATASAGTVPTYFYRDWYGSVRYLLSRTGNVLGSYTYSPYGSTLSHVGSSTPLQWQGQYTDAETGLIYLRARYYDSSSGQFITVDPAVTATQSAYTYAAGDPLDRVDPLGLSWWSTAVTVLAVVAVVSVVVATGGAAIAGGIAIMGAETGLGATVAGLATVYTPLSLDAIAVETTAATISNAALGAAAVSSAGGAALACLSGSPACGGDASGATADGASSFLDYLGSHSLDDLGLPYNPYDFSQLGDIGVPTWC